MTDEVKTDAAGDAGEDQKKIEAHKKKRMERAKSKAPKKPASDTGSDMAVDLEERIVAVNRVAKVVKGGRRFSFSALIVVGDKRGHVGYGLGKAREVPDAIRKASKEAQKKMVKVPVEKGTIPHEVIGDYGAAKILLKPAVEGTGIKAAGACRSILELAGVKNVLTKSLRTNNPHNVVKATLKALLSLRSKEEIYKVRGKQLKAKV